MKTKRILSVLLALCVCFITAAAAGCANKPDRKVVIQAGVGPPAAPLLYMMSEASGMNKGDIELIIYKSVEEATTRVIKKEADFSVLPLNVAAKLYNKGVGISLANVNTWGVLYLVTGDPEVKGLRDLKGKTVFVGAQGSSPDVITRYLLDKNGVGGVDIRYAQSPEIAQMLIKGLADTAVLPEPMVTQTIIKKQDLRIAADFYDEWQKAAGGKASLPQAGMVVSGEFLEKYPGLYDRIQEDFSKSLEKVIADPSLAAPLVEQEMAIPREVFVRTMERTRLDFVAGWDARQDVTFYLSSLLELSPEMVGGKAPDEKFYVQR